MDSLYNAHSVGPIVWMSENVRAALDDLLSLAPGERLVLLAPGGVPVEIPVQQWPAQTGVRWIMSNAQSSAQPDMLAPLGAVQAAEIIADL